MLRFMLGTTVGTVWLDDVKLQSGVLPDTTKPSVFITAPLSGAAVSGSVALAATASDNVGVSRVEFRVDGTLVLSDTAAPYAATWNAAAAAPGSHTITATAYDAAGNTSVATVSVTVPSDLLGGDGAFDTATQLSKWSLSYGGTGYAATTALDGGAARVSITQAAGQYNYLSLLHPVALTAGTDYTLSFRARADRPMTAALSLHKWSSPWNAWSDPGSVSLDTSWRTFELPCTSSGTDPAAMLRFMLGTTVGTVWLDDVKLQSGVL
jgi:hypothetical protein